MVRRTRCVSAAAAGIAAVDVDVLDDDDDDDDDEGLATKIRFKKIASNKIFPHSCFALTCCTLGPIR